MTHSAGHPNNQYRKADTDLDMWSDGCDNDTKGRGGGWEGEGGGDGDDEICPRQPVVVRKRLPFVFFKYVSVL